MTLNNYEQKHMIDLEEIWNDSGRYQFLNWDSFVMAMWKRSEDRAVEEVV